MITITNYNSGEVLVSEEGGPSVRLSRDASNRLIMMGRMHTVDEFIEKLSSLIPDETLVASIRKAFEGKTSTERWNHKEKFARLQTLSKGFEPKNPDQVWETVNL